jgi:hypothetical protein
VNDVANRFMLTLLFLCTLIFALAAIYAPLR